MANIYYANTLTGGGLTALDNIDGDDLNDLDSAIVVTQSGSYLYSLDADLNLSESSPDIIRPNTNPGTKCWALQAYYDPHKYISGLTISNGTDTDHDIDISTGATKDSTNAYRMELSSVLTKQLDATWAVGDDAGGLFTGSVAADTWYHVFLIRKDTDGSIDAGFDTSVSAANIPAGYTAYRRLGSVLTDGSSNILGFDAVEIAGGSLSFTWDAPVRDVALTTLPDTNRNLVALSVPLGVETIVKMNIYAADTVNRYIWVKSPTQTDVAASGTDLTLAIVADALAGSTTLDVKTNTSSQVAYRGDATTIDLYIWTLGWLDRRVD